MPLVRASAPLSPGRRSIDDEKAVAAVLCGRKRGFILDVQVQGLVDNLVVPGLGDQARREKTGRHGSRISQVEYPSKAQELLLNFERWKKVVVRLPGLQELKDSFTGLTVACNDVNSDKWLSRLANTRWFAVVIIL